MRVYTTGPYLVKPLRRHRTYIHDKPFVPRNDASFFSLTFHVRVLSGDLRIAPRNFSAKEVLEIALKM